MKLMSNKEMLLKKAQKHLYKFKELLGEIGGYSDLFDYLDFFDEQISEELQEEIDAEV